MRNRDLEEIRLEVRDRLEDGRQKGKTEVEAVSDIVLGRAPETLRPPISPGRDFASRKSRA